MAQDEEPNGETRAASIRVADASIESQLRRRLRADAPKRLSAIRIALKTQPIQFDNIVSEAHRLAGGAAYCGEPDVQTAAAALESSASNGRIVEMQQAWKALIREVEKLGS